MRIGIVVPQEILSEIRTFLSAEFPDTETVPFPYHSITEIPAILSGRQNRVDTMLFLGNAARRYAEQAVPHSSPWITIPRTSSSVLRLLFRAVTEGHAMRFATDLDNRDFFELSLTEVGISPTDAHIEYIPFFPYNEGLLVKDAARMESLYRSSTIAFCITIYYKVRDILKSKGIPVYILQPSFDDIRSGLERVLLSHEKALNGAGLSAIIAIHTDAPKMDIPSNSDFRISMERLTAAREVFRFGKSLEAAVTEQPPWDYLLFASRSAVENATGLYRQFPLLETVSSATPFTLSVGIGYGNTPAEAKFNALRAMEEARRRGGNKAFLAGKELFSPVPMSKRDHLTTTVEEYPMDKQFMHLAQKSGVSLRMISNLYYACETTGKRRFTTAELSDLLHVTPRTMNRVLNKLTDHHLAQDVGRHFSDKRGRPSRIIEILFQTKRIVSESSSKKQ